MRVAVVVLGDLGRSPRMLYHARSLGDTVGDVDLVGYVESEIPAAIAAHSRIRVHRLRAPVAGAATRLSRLAYIAYGFWRSAWQAVGLFWTLLVRLPRPDAILVQNPPAVPTLGVALVVARLRGARLIIDWHNFGFEMLRLGLRGHHERIVRAAARFERFFGRRADAHLCVSQAFAGELQRRWGISGATVLYDRAGDEFVPTPPAEREALFRRLGPPFDLLLAPDRPALVVSPTSWTADEDFGSLLGALRILDALWLGTMSEDPVERAARAPSRPRLLVVVTGDGPLRAHWDAQIAERPLLTIAVETRWLDPADYPRVVGAADLGVSLHRSASGLDLPMKIADMFGAGVPVCALDYGPCLAERVRQGETGMLFKDAWELLSILSRLLRGFPADTAALDALRAHVARDERTRWTEAWDAHARPLFITCRTR
jgi:beta-1,4-mannosyltransferase